MARQQIQIYSLSLTELTSERKRTRSPAADGLAPTEIWSKHQGVSLGLDEGTKEKKSKPLQVLQDARNKRPADYHEILHYANRGLACGVSKA